MAGMNEVCPTIQIDYVVGLRSRVTSIPVVSGSLSLVAAGGSLRVQLPAPTAIDIIQGKGHHLRTSGMHNNTLK